MKMLRLLFNHDQRGFAADPRVMIAAEASWAVIVVVVIMVGSAM